MYFTKINEKTPKVYWFFYEKWDCDSKTCFGLILHSVLPAVRPFASSIYDIPQVLEKSPDSEFSSFYFHPNFALGMSLSEYVCFYKIYPHSPYFKDLLSSSLITGTRPQVAHRIWLRGRFCNYSRKWSGLMKFQLS